MNNLLHELNELGLSKLGMLGVQSKGTPVSYKEQVLVSAKLKGIYNVTVVFNEGTTAQDFEDVNKQLKETFAVTKDATFYSNFPNNVPKDVMVMYLNSFYHYLTKDSEPLIKVENETQPQFSDEVFSMLKNLESNSLATITTVTPFNLLKSLYKYYVCQKLMVSDKERHTFYHIVSYLIKNYPNFELEIPKLGSLRAIQNTIVYTKTGDNYRAFPLLVKSIKTPTDILRFAAELSSPLSGDDISSIKSFKLTTHQKKIISSLLVYLSKSTKNSLYFETDLASHIKQWKTMFKVIQQYSNKGVKKAWIAIADNTFNNAYRSAASIVEASLESSASDTSYATALKYFPTLALRNLYTAVAKGKLRSQATTDAVLEAMKNSSSKLLVQLYNRAIDLQSNSQYRLVNVKGKLQLTIDNTPLNSKDKMVVGFIANEAESLLVERATKLNLSSLANNVVNTDDTDAVYDLSLTSSGRTSGNSVVTMGKFSAMCLKDHPYIRPLVHWSDNVDIDLSAVFYSQDGSQISRTAYTDLKNSFSCHSGDITSVSEGNEAVEAIWVDRNKALKHGAKYMLTQIIVYSGESLKNLDMSYGVAVHDSTKVSYRTTQGLLNATSSNADSTVIMGDLIDLSSNTITHVDTPVNTKTSGLNTYTTEQLNKVLLDKILFSSKNYLKVSDILISGYMQDLWTNIKADVKAQQKVVNLIMN